MAKNVILLMISFSFSFAAVAQAAGQPPKEVADLVAQLRRPTVTCAERVWNGFNWNDLQFVAVYPSKATSWAWDVAKNEITEVQNSSLSASVLGSGYEFFERSGKNSASLNMEEETSERVELITHEFFHDQGQKNWKSGGSGSRGTEYPLDWKPRFYRRMIYDALKTYFIGGSQADLAAASFWNKKWMQNYPMEVLATTDGYEGTAEYTEIMSSALASLGCNAKDSDLKLAAAKFLEKTLDMFMSGDQLSLDGEGYAIGSLAALILRFDSKRSLLEWNSQVAAGRTPLEILLETIPAVQKTVPKELARKFYSSARATNVEYSKDLDQPIRAWTDKSFVRMGIPSEWLLSNLYPKFFSTSKVLGADLFPLRIDHSYKSPTVNGNFVLKAGTVMIIDQSNFCGRQRIALVPKNSIIQKDDFFEVNSSTAVGTVRAKLKKNQDGFEYLCVEE